MCILPNQLMSILHLKLIVHHIIVNNNNNIKFFIKKSKKKKKKAEEEEEEEVDFMLNRTTISKQMQNQWAMGE